MNEMEEMVDMRRSQSEVASEVEEELVLSVENLARSEYFNCPTPTYSRR